MVEHIDEHLRIGCHVAIPRRKKGENLLSLEVKMEKNPALPVAQTRPSCSSPSEYQPFLSQTSSKVTILERAGGREERKREVVRNDYESYSWERSYSANS
jgi:hypothetical protein